MNTKAIYRLFTMILIFSFACNFATGLTGSGNGPKNFTAALTAPDVVMLTWDAVEGATGYILELSIDDGDSFSIVTLPLEYTSYEDLTASEKGNLTYQVQVITESGPAGKSQISIATGEHESNPFAVTPEYDEENATATVVGIQGGTLSLIDSNEVEYSLVIPQGALSVDTEIRMTAVAAIQDWPLDGASIGAVRLEPEGLILSDVAILTIGIPVDVNPDLATVGFAFQADGQEFHLQPTDDANELTDLLPPVTAHLASPAFQEPVRRIVLPVMELKVDGVGQASAASVTQYVKDHAPTDSGAALEKKWAAEAIADDGLAPLENITGEKDPARAKAFELIKAISNAENCTELNSQIASYQLWMNTRSYVGLTDDQRREYSGQVWEELAEKVKEVLEKAATECEKSSEQGGSAAADSPCAKALLENITTPPKTRSGFWDVLKDKMENKLSDGELQDIKDKLEKCKKAYTASGTSGPVTFDGVVCIDKPFELAETFETGSGTVSFTPSSAMSGVVTDASNSGGCDQSGEGSYMINLNEDGSGELQWTILITASCPPYSVSKPYTFVLPLRPAPVLSCP